MIRFAKDLVTNPLYFSPLNDQLAFTPDIMKAFGLRTRAEAEDMMAQILMQIKSSNPDLYDKFCDPGKGLCVEEHTFGDHLQ